MNIIGKIFIMKNNIKVISQTNEVYYLKDDLVISTEDGNLEIPLGSDEIDISNIKWVGVSGSKHNIDGPAVFYPKENYKEYWVNGVKMEEYEHKLKFLFGEI